MPTSKHEYFQNNRRAGAGYGLRTVRIALVGLSVVVFLIVAGCSRNSDEPTATTVVETTTTTTTTAAPIKPAVTTTSTTTSPTQGLGPAEDFEPVVEGILSLSPANTVDLMSEIWIHPGFTIIDMRSPDKYVRGHIAGAVNMYVNAGDFEKRLSEMGRENEYIVYCDSVACSDQVKETMERMGFQSVADIDGGFLQWVADGFAWTTETES